MNTLNDTIVAISTPIGKAAIGIIRLSGNDAFKIADKIFTPSKQKNISSQKKNTSLYGIIKTEDGKINDEALAIVFKKPQSYTGQNMVEFNCHSNPLLLNNIVDHAVKFGARIAQPGEFTKRAYINNKIDLLHAEAINNIINAKSKRALQSATKNIYGEQNNIISDAVKKMETLITDIEAEINFPEEIIININTQKAKKELVKISNELNGLLKIRDEEHLLSQGIKCSILGKPNVGKSTMINTLLERERAIVTDTPGTTRDIIKDSFLIKGIPIEIIDTAGISSSPDEIESIGIKKTIDEIKKSSLLIILFDGSKKISSEDIKVIDIVKNQCCIYVINKSDLNQKIEIEKFKSLIPNANPINISAKFSKNIDCLKSEIYETMISENFKMEENYKSISLTLHNIIIEALKHIQNAISAISTKLSIEFIAEDIKNALKSLGQITGNKAPENIMNDIFSKFCIGK